MRSPEDGKEMKRGREASVSFSVSAFNSVHVQTVNLSHGILLIAAVGISGCSFSRQKVLPCRCVRGTKTIDPLPPIDRGAPAYALVFFFLNTSTLFFYPFGEGG